MKPCNEDVFPPCPACGEQLYISESDAGIPSTWNRCCSPECGNHMDGVMEVAPCHPKALAWREMDSIINAAVEARSEKQAACDHDWQDEPKDRFGHRVYKTYRPTESGGWDGVEFATLECTKCHATKPGKEISHA